MNFDEWQKEYAELERAVESAKNIYHSMCDTRDEFLIKTLGFKVNDVATLAGTAQMISRVIDMKAGRDVTGNGGENEPVA